MAEQLEAFLAHYGVLGMHWGKRKSAAPKASVPSHEDHNQSRQILKTRLDQVSSKDLATTNKRLQQEKTLRELRSQQHVIAKGQTQVKVLLALAGTATSVYALGNSELGKKLINQATPVVKQLLGSKGKHTLHYIVPVVKAAARHI